MTSGIFALGYLGLLGGLLLGMPSLDELDDEGVKWDEDEHRDELEPGDLGDPPAAPDGRVD